MAGPPARFSEGRSVRTVSDRWHLTNLPIVLALILTTVFLPESSLDAQEIIDRQTGRPFVAATDLALQAGPINLEVRRFLESGRREPGLLGVRWRLNWESRLLRADPFVLIEEAGVTVQFDSDERGAGYRSAAGEQLVFDRQGRAIRTKPDGTTETFDIEGRLVQRDDPNGNKVVLHYGANGRLAKIDGPHGSYLKVTTDKAGRATLIETTAKAAVRYVYRASELIEVHRPAEPPTLYGYFTDGRLARIVEPRVGAIQFAYDFKGRIRSRSWADGSKETYQYDATGSQLRHTDPLGGMTTYQWGPDKRREEITDPLGRKSVLEYDAARRPVSITGPTGATARISYDARGRTVMVENPLGQRTRIDYVGDGPWVKAIAHPDGGRQVFEYDHRNNLLAVKVGVETVAAFTYFPDGRVASIKGLYRPEQRFTYDPNGRIKSVANALGEATRYEYDARGNLIREVNPLGGVTVRSYDADGRLLNETNPIGGTTRYEYDAKGRLNKIADPVGGIWRFEYDVRGRLMAETNPLGRVTRYEYDKAGSLVKVGRPGSGIEAIQYNPLGNPVQQSDPLGRVVHFDYDQLGRLVREGRPTGFEMAYRYDALGSLVGLEDSTGAGTMFQRDATGLLTANVDPLGAVTRYQYDPLGRLAALTDPRGKIKRFTYSPDGALARVQEPSGDAGRYEYDAAGRLVALHRPSGGVTRLSYDAMGNLTSITDPLGNRRRRAYDLAGRLVSATDAVEQETRFRYDPSGRVTEKQLPDGKRVTYQYDRLGNLLLADNGRFPIRFSYDEAGRLIKTEYPSLKKSITVQYDSRGLRTSLIDSAGRQVRYEYTPQKQLAAIALPDRKRIAFTYDAMERPASIQYPNGIAGRWEYDAAGRIVKITYQGRDGSTVARSAYRYDPAGNLVERLDTHGRSTRYLYDAAGQLIEETGPELKGRYRYLPGGSRGTMEADGATTQYRADAADRLLQAGPEHLTYDANGNLISRKGPAGTTSYEYDAENQLVKVVGPGGALTTFGYAPTGKRIWKRDAGGLTYYLYDGLDLIQELGEKGKLQATYVHGQGIDRPVTMLRDAHTYYYHADRLGSVSHLTDEQGQVAAVYEYDPFGRPRTWSASVANSFTFTGREFDAGTGLYYYRARYYDPSLGRFLSPDPIPPRLSDPLELNPYLYVGNNPLRFADPLGLDFQAHPWMPPAEELYHVEQNVKGNLNWAEHPAWQWGGHPEQFREYAAYNQARAEALRQQFPGLQPRPPWERPPATPTTRVPRPGTSTTPIEGPRPGTPTTATPRPGSKPPPSLGISPGYAGALTAALLAEQINECIERGMSAGECATRIGVGVAIGAAVVGGVAVVAGSAGVTVVTFGGIVYVAGRGVVSIGELLAEAPYRGIRDYLDRSGNEAAAEAQREKNFERFDRTIRELEAQINALGALRNEIAGAEETAEEASQRARNAAAEAKRLLGQLRGFGTTIAEAVNACKEVGALMEGIKAAAANAKRYAELAEKGFDFARAKVEACRSKEEVASALEAFEAAKGVAAGAGLNYRRVLSGLDKLERIRARSREARAALAEAGGVVAKISAEVDPAKSGAESARGAAERAQKLLADLKARKNALLARIEKIRGILPPGETVDQRLEPMRDRLRLEEAGLMAGIDVNSANESVVSAQSSLAEARAILNEFMGLPLCDAVPPPDAAIDEAASALTSLGFAGMGEGIREKAAACQDRLAPERAPSTAGQGYDPSKDPGMGGPTGAPGPTAPGEPFPGGPYGTGEQPPGGPTQPVIPQPPAYTGTEPQPATGPLGATGPQPGYPPYPPSPPCGIAGYPPCPPGYAPPYEPSIRVPWGPLVPPPGPTKPTSPTGPIVCPPGCHPYKDGRPGCDCTGR
jgi:RHS repeat-associated protein